jgi:gliding motility-associated-like protein
MVPGQQRDPGYYRLTGYTDDTIYIANPESNYMNYYVTYIYYVNGCRMMTNAHAPMTPPPPFLPDITVNIFSPNGDNKNDRFMPFYDPNVSQIGINYYADEFNMKIYDRWGKFVFETSSYLQGWDGKRNNKDADDGNYFWIATYKPRCGNGAPVSKQGFVQVIH